MEETDIKVEYDSVYPPLNKPVNNGNRKKNTKKSAIEKAVAQAASNKCIIITPSEKRSFDTEKHFQDIIQDLSQKYNVVINTTVSNMGNLLVDVKKTPHTKDLALSKFIVKEVLTKQTKKIVKISEKNVRRLSERRYQEEVCKNISAKFRVDHQSESVIIEGGQVSVQRVVDEISNYLKWNTDIITINLDVHCKYYDFIRGPDGKTAQDITTSSGKYVEIIFDSPANNSVILSGNRSCVEAAKVNILNLIKKFDNFEHATFTVNHKQQIIINDRFGPNLFEQERVSLKEVPQFDQTIIFHIFGEPERVNKVKNIINEICIQNYFERIKCPYYICKFLQHYQEFSNAIRQMYPELSYTILPSLNCIEIMCDYQHSSDVNLRLSNLIQDLTNSLSHESYPLDENLVRFLEDKNDFRLKEIQSNTSALIFYEKDRKSNVDDAFNNFMFIVGDPTQTKRAAESIKEAHQFLLSFQTKEISIPHHLHRYIIGTKGKVLKEFIDKNGKNCTVSFSKDVAFLDRCTIKGPLCEINSFIVSILEKCDELKKIHKLYTIQVASPIASIFISDQKNIRSKILSFGHIEQINFFDEDPTVFRCVARADVIDKVEGLMKSCIAEFSQAVTKETSVPEKLSSIVNNFSEEVSKVINDDVGGGLSIVFSKTINHKEKVTLFGPATLVDLALNLIKKYGSGSNSEHFMDVLKLSHPHARDIKENIFKIIGTSGVRVFFHFLSKIEDCQVLVVGKMDDVNKLKKDISYEIDLIVNTIEKVLMVKAEYKKEFLKKRKDDTTLVQRLSLQHGNVRIHVGDKVANGDQIAITLNGHKDFVNKLESVINDMIQEFDSRIEMQVTFKVKDLHNILLYNKSLLKNSMDLYNVVLSVSENYYQIKSHDISTEDCQIKIKGLPQDAAAAYEKIVNWKIVHKSLEIPLSTQRQILNQSNEHFNYITYHLCVTLDMGCTKVPQTEQINLTGLESSVNDAVKLIDQIIEEWYEIKVKIPQKYFTRLIGKRGSNIQKFNTEYNVRVVFPKQTEYDTVLVVGPKANCFNASTKLLSIVNEWESSISRELVFDSRAKFKLFGQENSQLRKIGNELKATIRLVPCDDKNSPQRTLSISGQPADVNKAYSYLQSYISGIMDELDEEYMYQPPRYNPYELDVSSLSTMVYVNQSKGTKATQKTEDIHRGNPNNVSGSLQVQLTDESITEPSKI